VIVSEHTLIVDNWKLFMGHHKYAVWQSAVWPDSKTPTQDQLRDEVMNCFSATNLPNAAAGCLFDVAEDESEKRDMAGLHQDVVQEMMAKLDEYVEGFYENDRVGTDSCPDDYELTVSVGTGKSSTQHLECGCWMATYNYGSFDGPYQDLNEDYIRFVEGEGLKAIPISKEMMVAMEHDEEMVMNIGSEEEMVIIEWDDKDTALTSPRVDLKMRYLNVVFGICGLILCLCICAAIRYCSKKAKKPTPLLSDYDSEFYGINRT